MSLSPVLSLQRSSFRPRCLLFGLCFWLIICCSLTAGAQTSPSIRWMRGDSSSEVSGGVLAPDNSFFVTAGSDNTIKVHRADNGMLLSTLHMPDLINVFALSPDGTRIAVCGGLSSSSPLNIWRLSDGALLKTLPHPTPGGVSCLAWSPDGKRLAAAQDSTGAPSAVLVWDINTGSLIYTLNGHTAEPLTVAFSPDNSRLVSAGWDKTVRLWSMADGTLLQTMTGHGARITTVAITPDNRTIASGCSDGTTRVWDAASGSQLYALNVGSNSVAFSLDGTTLAGGSSDGVVSLWKTADGSLLHSATITPYPAGLASVSYSKDGSLLFATALADEYTLYNSADLTIARNLPSDPSEPPAILGLTPNGQHIVYPGESIIRVWNTATGAQEVQTLDPGIPLKRSNLAIAMAPNSTTFATLDESPSRGISLRIWNLADGSVLLDKVLGSTDSIGLAPSIAWSADGQYLFYTTTPINSGSSRSMVVLKSVDASLVTTMSSTQTYTSLLAVSPDGKWLAASGSTSTVELYNLSTFTLARTFNGPTAGCTSLAFSADSARLLTGSTANVAILWNVADGSIFHTFAHPAPVAGVALSPDGYTLATECNDGRLRVWSVMTGALLRDYTGEGGLSALNHSSPGPALFYTSDHQSIVYGRPDSVIAVAENPYANPNLIALNVSPGSVVGGHGSLGAVTLQQPAPEGGILISITSDNARASVPDSVLIPEGGTSATFPITTSPTTTPVKVNITVSNDISFATAVLTVTPPTAALLSVSPATVKGGQNSTGTVTISDPAPAGGVTVVLSTSNTALATVPTGVFVPAGATQASFPVTTQAVNTTRSVALFATLGPTASTTLTLTPPTVDALSVSPASLKGGQNSTGTVTLSDPAPAGGVTVSLSSDKSVASVPGSVVVTAGFKTATFPITTTPVSTDTVATVKAVLNGQSQTAALTVQAPALAAFRVDPTAVRALQTATATVTIDSPAPVGGTVVALGSSDLGVASLPAHVTVPAGAKTVTATVTTGYVSSTVQVTLAAALGSGNQSVSFTVQPHLPFDFDNDGHNDLVFQNQNNNRVALWYTNVLQILGGDLLNYSPPMGWQVVGCADINHDGTPDLFLQNQTTGKINVWYLQGAAVTGGEELSMSPQGGYKVVGVGDFNNDGKPDLLFQNPTNGQLVIWYLDGAKVVGGVALPQMPAAGYNVVGVGDFNGDGKPDIVFQNQTSNQVVIWYMNGSVFTGNGGATAYAPQSGWQVKAVEDINGDGKPDLIFQNQTTNQVLAWFMDGQNILGGGLTSVTPDAGYLLRGPH